MYFRRNTLYTIILWISLIQSATTGTVAGIITSQSGGDKTVLLASNLLAKSIKLKSFP